MDAPVRWVRDLPPARADALLAGGLAIVLAALTPLVPTAHGYRHTDALTAVLAALASLPLAFRRRYPVMTLAVSTAPALVYLGRGYDGGPALLAPLVALYTVATVEPRLRSLALGVLVAGLMAAARQIFPTESAPVGSVVTSAVGFIGAALFLGWAVANRRAYVAEIRDRAERDERLRIARELHDAVAHSIATINVQAGAAAHVIDKQPEQATQALGVIRQTSKQALAELREILGVLRDEDSGEPRAPAAGLDQLDRLLDDAREAGVNVELEVHGTKAPLPTAVDLAAYRILQESLTNIARHAGTDRAKLTIVFDPAAVVLTITDDGAGGRTFRDGTGHGLTGMRERAQALGGTLEAGPRSQGGFEVRASLPVHTQLSA